MKIAAKATGAIARFNSIYEQVTDHISIGTIWTYMMSVLAASEALQ